MDLCNQYDFNYDSIDNETDFMYQEIRQKFLAEYLDNKDLYDKVDVEKVMKDNFWVRRFVDFLGQGPEDGFEHMKECLRWRKSYGVNTWDPLSIPKEIYQMGIIFDYEPDKDGVTPVYLRLKLYRHIDLIDEATKKYVLSHFEKLDNKMRKEKAWSFIIDFAGMSLTLLDMQMYLFITKTIRNYFPLGCKYIAIINLPWVLKSVVKQSLRLLPSDMGESLHFTTQDELTSLFEPENLPDFLKGNCKRPYKVPPKGARTYLELGQKDYGLTLDKAEKAFKPYTKLMTEESRS